MVVRKVSPEAKCGSAEVMFRWGTVLRPVWRWDYHLREVGRGLGHHQGCGFPAAARATVGTSEPSSLADFLGPMPCRFVLAAPSELLRDLGSSSTSRTFWCTEGGRNPGFGA